ncbi:MAG TPA: YceD family protein, partial [Anaerolineae bacterium]
PDCKGLCIQCGQNLNEGPCGCANTEVDPRLATLKTLLQ